MMQDPKYYLVSHFLLQKAHILTYEKRYEDIIEAFNKLKRNPSYKHDPIVLYEVGKAYIKLEKYDCELLCILLCELMKCNPGLQPHVNVFNYIFGIIQ